jgi:hypothetical protein
MSLARSSLTYLKEQKVSILEAYLTHRDVSDALERSSIATLRMVGELDCG